MNITAHRMPCELGMDPYTPQLAFHQVPVSITDLAGMTRGQQAITTCLQLGVETIGNGCNWRKLAHGLNKEVAIAAILKQPVCVRVLQGGTCERTRHLRTTSCVTADIEGNGIATVGGISFQHHSTKLKCWARPVGLKMHPLLVNGRM